MNIASLIDHTILKPDTTFEEVAQLCSEAESFRFAAVCVPPGYVAFAKKELHQSAAAVATVIGFPFGYSHTDAKVSEVRQALADGADELDIVQNITAIKNCDWDYLEREMRVLTSIIHAAGKKVKIILETALLTDHEIIRCCELYAPMHPQFLKTSTGYSGGGATVHAVLLMRANLPAAIGIKASGGIRTFAAAMDMVNAGASRLGCSASVSIVGEAKP
ncbi:MAG: deoxyribose-phosphate aldolase [Sphingobacteriales bacterium]|nr:MAG: deoxyribose-phosphate aldolase [Sphingobacteriales bacterium]